MPDSRRPAWIAELKAFLTQGNVLDLAVAVIIGLAFGAVVTALVDGVLMPLIAAVAGKPSFDALTIGIGSSTIKYGTFLTAVVNFLIVASAMFVVVKVATKLRPPKVIDVTEPEPTEAQLLKEIRDLLATRSGTRV